MGLVALVPCLKANQTLAEWDSPTNVHHFTLLESSRLFVCESSRLKRIGATSTHKTEKLKIAYTKSPNSYLKIHQPDSCLHNSERFQSSRHSRAGGNPSCAMFRWSSPFFSPRIAKRYDSCRTRISVDSRNNFTSPMASWHWVQYVTPIK